MFHRAKQEQSLIADYTLWINSDKTARQPAVRLKNVLFYITLCHYAKRTSHESLLSYINAKVPYSESTLKMIQCT